MEGNVLITESYDTGKKFQKADGSIAVIKRKTVDFGALPNAATKDVAHGVTVDEYFQVKEVIAKVTATDVAVSVDPSDVSFDGTNVSYTATGDESANEAKIIIEYI